MGAVLNAVVSSEVNTPAIVTDNGTILAANPVRKGLMIQNVGTNTVFVRFGAAASTSVFHVVLKGGTGDSDGNGGSLSMLSGQVYQGLVSMTSSGAKVVITELT